MEGSLSKSVIKGQYLSLMGIEDSILARLFLNVRFLDGMVLVEEYFSKNIFAACIENFQIIGFTELNEIIAGN